MKSRPILFSAPMVRAILDGTKTQTRRVCKLTDSGRVKAPGSSHNWHLDDPDCWMASPYGTPGSELWVKETCRVQSLEGECVLQYRSDMSIVELPEYAYPNDPILRKWLASQLVEADKKWKPSIFMPRAASRITLEITGVRVERLRDISPHDALAEGVGHNTMGNPAVDYQNLWESINGPGSWEANPWVWVISFRRIKP